MKLCKFDNCNNKIFTHGYCKRHSYIYYGEKGKTKTKKVFKKKTGEKSIFEHIWETRPHKSFISGQDLDFYVYPYFFNLFAHVLSKNKYPEFRLYDKNIILLTPYEHFLLDQGTEEQRSNYNADWELIYKLKGDLIAEYSERRHSAKET